MELPRRLTKFLKKHKVDYDVETHRETFTACDTAQAEHISGKKLVKAVIAKVNGKDVMLVLPSHRTVDLFSLGTMLDTKNVRIEEEKEFQDLFPDCEVGALPALGDLYHLSCYADKSIQDEEELYFSAGNRRQTIRISTADFLRVSKAILGDFSVVGRRLVA